MPNIYGTSTDVESDDSLSPSSMGPTNNSNYVDPWDLENYAYLKEHLDSPDLPSSDPTTLEDFIEAQSSFDYVPVLTPKNYSDTTFTTKKYDTLVNDYGTYVCIDELDTYRRRKTQNESIYGVAPKRAFVQGRRSEIRIPIHTHKNSVTSHYERNDRNHKKCTNQYTYKKYGNNRDRSKSFAYGDGYEIYPYKHEIYCSPTAEKPLKEDIYYPIYDDPKNIRKPNNFGLSNYGHLKIDYSYSWNNLNKYIIS